MHNEFYFGRQLRLDRGEHGNFKAIVEIDPERIKGWLAVLSPADPGNKLGVFYKRQYQTPALTDGVSKTFWLEDGVYEIETVGKFGAHRYALQVTKGHLAWTYSLTFNKRQALTKIAESLAP